MKYNLLILMTLCTACTVCGGEEIDRFGGNKAIKSKATGFFRVEEFNERWLFVTPEGHGYVALGANHVGKYLDLQAVEMGLMARFDGDRAKSAEFLVDQMKQMGLTAGEAYAPLAPELKPVLPWVANLRFPSKSKFAFDVFDPAFQEKLRQSVIKQCVELRDDPMVLGIAFADLPIWDRRRVQYFEQLGPSSPGGKVLAEYRKAGKSDNEFLGYVADILYEQLAGACRRGAPNHLFFGERHRLRGTPDEVLRSIGKHVDVFCTQALILSPQRPPEWQVFQAERYDYEQKLTGKPMLIIDWAAPFSLSNQLETEKGTLRAEQEAAKEAATWLIECMKRPYMIGVFKCQLIGLHGNDRWFEGKARRTYLKDNGESFVHRTRITRQAHETALHNAYKSARSDKKPQDNLPQGRSNGTPARDGEREKQSEEQGAPLPVRTSQFSQESEQDDDGWTQLFNGKDLSGWTVRSGKAKFEVVDEMIVGSTVAMSPNSFLCTEREYADFELKLEVHCDLELNSGIQIRSQIAEEGTQITIKKNPDKPKTITLPKDRVYGYQVEIARGESGRSGGIYDEARRFVFLDDLDGNSKAQSAFRNDEWNHIRIRCKSDRLQTWVNGVACADVRDSANSKGIIGLQVHGNISVTGRIIKKKYHKHLVRFRNIRIRELPTQYAVPMKLSGDISIQPAEEGQQ